VRVTFLPDTLPERFEGAFRVVVSTVATMSSEEEEEVPPLSVTVNATV
jgi:hypothetical protein